MSTIEPRRVTCPFCAETSDGWLVLAGQSSGPMTTDLRRYADGEDPLPKQLCSCAGCGWVGDVSDFEERAPEPDLAVPADAAGAWYSQDGFEDSHDPMLIDGPRGEDSTLGALVERHLRPAAARSAADPAFRYEQHAQVQRWRGAGPLREGDAWLRAAWMHGDAERADDERRCRTRALGCYRQGVEEQRWFKRREDLVVIAYLVGELHRRLGDASEAGRWFEQTAGWSSGLPHMQDLLELAERQGRDPRDVV